ncbi:MAG: hypothetical protein IJX27_05710 [Clostridia bacterium]|nr:hypothetical protein [Clostridia bacterium]
MATEIYVCLDLGNDTLKISFAYETRTSERYGKLMVNDLVNHVAIPAMAYYDEDERIWKFADELERTAGKPFHTVVKIKSILTMFVKPEEEAGAKENLEYYTGENLFPKFCFPERNKYEPLFKTLVDKKLVFTVPGCTPKKLCEDFFRYVKTIAEQQIKALSEQTGIAFAPLRNIALVYPPKQGKQYVDELTRLVWYTFGEKPMTVLTSTQALGLLAFHKRMISGEERALIFDMGDETVSVAKTWLNDNDAISAGILIDSREAHSKPIEVGGSDIDETMAKFLGDAIYERETIGYPSSGEEGHIYESGLFANQYLMMKDIKKSKTAMPLAGSGMFKDGVPITIHREVQVQRLITESDFYGCTGTGEYRGVAKKVMDYILAELRLAVNRDVTKIIFAGGMIETHGLLEFIKKQLHGSYPHIRVYKFEETPAGAEATESENPYDIQFYEASAYSSSLGGAIVAMRNYSVDNVLSYSYGTWLYHPGSEKKHLKLFAERGSLLKEKENRFAMAASFVVDRKPQERIDGDELFSTIISTKEIEARRYSDRLTYEDEFLIIGEAGDYNRTLAEDVIDLKIVGGGSGTEINFYYKDDRVSLYTKSGEVPINFEEGFVVDQDGRAVPFFSNMRAYNNEKVTARSVRTGAIYNINTKDVEFRLQISELKVTTQS